jgi:hypothetical protein
MDVGGLVTLQWSADSWQTGIKPVLSGTFIGHKPVYSLNTHLHYLHFNA